MSSDRQQPQTSIRRCRTKVFLLAVCLLIPFTACVGTSTPGETATAGAHHQPATSTQPVASDRTKLIPFAVQDPKSDLWGFVDATGAWVIAPSFKRATSFADYLNLTGYKTAGPFSQATDPKSELRGIIDTTGAWIIEPEYKYISPAGYGLFEARTDDGMTGFVNETDEWVVEPIFSESGTVVSIVVADNLIAYNCDDSQAPDACMFYDFTGKVIAQPGIYFSPSDYLGGGFVNGKATACYSPRNCGIINFAGDMIAPLPGSADAVSTDGIAVSYLVGDYDYKEGIVDWSGNWIKQSIADGYILMDQFDQDSPCPWQVTVDDKIGLIDHKGTWITKPKYKSTSYTCGDGLLGVSLDNVHYGYINTAGQWVIKPNIEIAPNEQKTGDYTSLPSFADGFAPAWDPATKKWGFINENGSMVISGRFADVYS